MDASCVMTSNDRECVNPKSRTAPLLADRKTVRHRPKANQKVATRHVSIKDTFAFATKRDDSTAVLARTKLLLSSYYSPESLS
ncbi:hypothetical protein PUN28_009503 [Cardiocondyla obscurior]|uniref:Uncharacterized protein n=1 Tax=Cardiocondyla obscurior TaxID=286306 RepID=A0AAW2FYB3_9HYME